MKISKNDLADKLLHGLMKTNIFLRSGYCRQLFNGEYQISVFKPGIKIILLIGKRNIVRIDSLRITKKLQGNGIGTEIVK